MCLSLASIFSYLPWKVPTSFLLLQLPWQCWQQWERQLPPWSWSFWLQVCCRCPSLAILGRIAWSSIQWFFKYLRFPRSGYCITGQIAVSSRFYGPQCPIVHAYFSSGLLPETITSFYLLWNYGAPGFLHFHSCIFNNLIMSTLKSWSGLFPVCSCDKQQGTSPRTTLCNCKS